MPGQVPKQVASQIAGDRNEGVAGDPARNTPQQVVRGDQRRQEQEAKPGISGMCADVKSSRQGIESAVKKVSKRRVR